MNESKNKFSWRTMCLTMTEIKEIINFFNVHVREKNKGVRSTLEKIEFYDEEQQILSEKVEMIDISELPVTDASELNEVGIAVRVKCYIFVKAP